MRSRLVALLTLVALAGCAEGPTWTRRAAVGTTLDNPLLIPVTNHEVLYEGVVDVIGDYFRIAREEPVRMMGDTLQEGIIETYPKSGATFLEPWEHDSADGYERFESTLQSIRRRAVVKITQAPQCNGFCVEVIVTKELENVPTPEHSTAGASTFRYDNSMTRVINPGFNRDPPRTWINQGRDTALEQRILGQLSYRFTPEGTPIPLR